MLCFGGPQYTTYTTLGCSPKRGDGCKAGDRPRTPGLVPALMRHLRDSRTHRGLCSSHSSCPPKAPPVIWGPSAPPGGWLRAWLTQKLRGRCQAPRPPLSSSFSRTTAISLQLPLGAPSEFLFLEKNHNLSSDEISCCLETWRWKHKNSPGNLRRSCGGDFGHLILPSLL